MSAHLIPFLSVISAWFIQFAMASPQTELMFPGSKHVKVCGQYRAQGILHGPPWVLTLWGGTTSEKQILLPADCKDCTYYSDLFVESIFNLNNKNLIAGKLTSLTAITTEKFVNDSTKSFTLLRKEKCF